MRIDNLFCFEKWGLLAYLNEDKELVERRKCEGTRDVVIREKKTKEKQVKTN